MTTMRTPNTRATTLRRKLGRQKPGKPFKRGVGMVMGHANARQTEEETSHGSSSSLSTSASAFASLSESEHAPSLRRRGSSSRRRQLLGFLASGAALVTSSGMFSPRASLAFSNPEPLGDGTKRVYGEATTAASYGGYGGSDKSEDRFKYTYEVPEEWRAETINKIEKGVTGIDNRQSANKNTKAYVITFPGYLKLKDDRDAIISDLAIADIQLQDVLQGAESFESRSRTNARDQLFYDYDITGFNNTTMLATATVDGGRIYILVVFAPTSDYVKNKNRYESIRGSLNTLSQGVNQEDIDYFKRAT